MSCGRVVNFDEITFTLGLSGYALAKIPQQRWTDQEFAVLDLGDGHINKGAKILMERFAASPTASIPDACDSWSETCAGYRFLSNHDIEWGDIQAPHWAQTHVRMGRI